MMELSFIFKLLVSITNMGLCLYMGVCGFFLQVKFATSLLAFLAGGKRRVGKSRSKYCMPHRNSKHGIKCLPFLPSIKQLPDSRGKKKQKNAGIV